MRVTAAMLEGAGWKKQLVKYCFETYGVHKGNGLWFHVDFAGFPPRHHTFHEAAAIFKQQQEKK